MLTDTRYRKKIKTIFCLECWTLKMKAIRSLETSKTTHQTKYT